MASCFMEKADLRPYTSVANNIPLDQMNPEVADIRDPRERHWAEVSQGMPLEDIDEADEDTLNRVLWYAMRRDDASYPAWAVLPETEWEEEEEED